MWKTLSVSHPNELKGEVNMSPDERNISMSQHELQEIKEIYQSVMNLAANGLFFRAGQVLGRGIAKRAEQRGGPYLTAAAELDREMAMVEGCIETCKGIDRSCNILRGVLAEIYARHYETKLFCHEVECSGGGAPRCTFQIRKGVL